MQSIFIHCIIHIYTVYGEDLYLFVHFLIFMFAFIFNLIENVLKSLLIFI